MKSLRLMAVLQLCCALAAAQNLNCGSIAQTLKEYSISTSSSAYLNSVFDNYCEQSGETKSSGFQIGADVVVKAIPIKFTLGATSSDTSMKNFCKNYSSLTQSSEHQTTYEEKIASKALETLDDCLRLSATEGVLVTHGVTNKAALNFFLQASVKNPISFTGLTVTGPVTCAGQINGKLLTFGAATAITIGKTQNISCKRTSKKQGSLDVFDEATITLATNYGNYDVLWPRDERLPEDMASGIARSMDTLSAQVASRRYTIKWDEEIAVDLKGPNSGAGDSTPHTLGKHDVCVITNTDFHIAVNGESSCSLALSEGVWSVKGHRDATYGSPGSATWCAARCGDIQ